MRDITSGYKVIDAGLLGDSVGALVSSGYAFQIELLQEFRRARAVIVEVPIEFVERRYGKSKMSKVIVLEALMFVTLSGVRSLSSKRRL